MSTIVRMIASHTASAPWPASAVAWKGLLWILGELLHPIAQLRRVNVQVLRRLHIRYASILNQAHRLKLELPRKLPSLHDPPPAPSKHLTRCLRNRVQANPRGGHGGQKENPYIYPPS